MDHSFCGCFVDTSSDFKHIFQLEKTALCNTVNISLQSQVTVKVKLLSKSTPSIRTDLDPPMISLPILSEVSREGFRRGPSRIIISVLSSLSFNYLLTSTPLWASFRARSPRGSIYIENSFGPRTDPCGTTKLTSLSF